MTTNSNEQLSQDMVELNNEELDAVSGGKVDVDKLRKMLEQQSKGKYHINPILKELIAKELHQSDM